MTKRVIQSFILCLLVIWQFSLAQQAVDSLAALRIDAWHSLVDSIRAADDVDDMAKLKQVNDFFNQVEWQSDQEHWGQADYWATPLEMLETNAGDCEDFAIAKYFSLRMVGVSAERLRIQYVKAIELNQAHMVLTYYPPGQPEPLILDNLDKQIKPASERYDLIPVYSFDVDDLWLAQSRKQQPMLGKASVLKAWQETKARMMQRGEFFDDAFTKASAPAAASD